MRTALIPLLLALWATTAQAAPPLPEVISAEVEAARQDGLPTDALEAKAQEGLAKGIPPARVAAVIGQMRQDMASTSSVLDSLALGASRAEIVAAATLARRAGATDHTLTEVARLSEPHRARALRSLADLLGQEVPEPEATRLVALAVDTRQPDVALREVTVATSRLRSRGFEASEAAHMVTVAMGEGLPPLSVVSVDEGGPPPAVDGKTMPWQAFGGNAGGQGKDD